MKSTPTRRDFCAASLAAGLWASLPTSARGAATGGAASTRDDEAPMLRLDKVSAAPVKIVRIEVLRRGGDHFVVTTSADGATGVHVNNGREYLVPLLKEVVAPVFIDRDARDLETLVDEVYRVRSNYKLAGLAFWNCVGWVEISLMDMLGRIAGKPVAELLGGVRRREIPVYISSLRRDTTPEQEVERVAKRLGETGAKALKFKVGGRMSRNADAMPGRTDKLVPLLRKTLGDGVTLYADANGSYDAAKGIEVGRLLEDHGVAIYEEPCPFDEYEETKRVTDALRKIKVAGGEQDTSLARFRWITENRALDVVQPDISYNGGLIRTLKVARMAERAGLGIAPHNPKTGAREAHLLQFAACVPNLEGYQEYHMDSPQPEPWAAPRLEARDGKIAVPTGPGLGVTIDPEMLKKAERL